MEFVLEIVGYGLALPAVIAAAVPLAARRLGGPRAAARLAPLAVGGAFLAAYTLFSWAPWFPSPGARESWQWAPYLVLFAAALGATDPGGDGPGQWRLVAVAAASWFLIPMYPRIDPVRHLHMSVLACSVLTLAGPLRSFAARYPGPLLPGLLAAVAFAAAFLLGHAGSAKFAQLAGVVAASMAGLAAATLFYRKEAWLAAAMPLYALLLVGLLYVGHEGAVGRPVPTYCFALIGGAPLLLGVCLPATPDGCFCRRRHAACAGLVLLPVAAAVAISLLS